MKMSKLKVAIRATQYIMNRVNVRSKLIHTDKDNNLYIIVDVDKRVYLRDVPGCILPCLFKLLDYERTGLNPDDIGVLIERWKDV